MKDKRITLNKIGMIGFILLFVGSLFSSIENIAATLINWRIGINGQTMQLLNTITLVANIITFLAIPFAVVFMISCFMSMHARRGALLQGIAVCVAIFMIIEPLLLNMILSASLSHSEYELRTTLLLGNNILTFAVSLVSLLLFSIGSIQCAKTAGKVIHIIALAIGGLNGLFGIGDSIYVLLKYMDIIEYHPRSYLMEAMLPTMGRVVCILVAGVILASRIVACVQANRALKVASV